MSRRADGLYYCDRCGVGVGNGSVQRATKITGLDPDARDRVRYLDLCIAARDGAPFGCTGFVLNPTALVNYYETRTP